MKLYNVTDSYIDFLKDFDSKVPDNKNEKRPFVGIVLRINDCNFFAPLSSPKPKHRRMRNTADFHKINGGIHGAINFNNMIPISQSELILIDIDNISDRYYKNLLNSQIRFINSEQDTLKLKAKRLYELVKKDNSSLSGYQVAIKDRCVNFSLLQEKSKLSTK